MSLISNNVWAISSLRDHQKITFVTLNRFCPLANPPPPSPPLFLMKKTKLDEIPNKIKWKIHVFWYIAFHVLKVFLIKEYKIQLVYQSLYFLFYITSQFTSGDIIFTIFWNLIQHLLEKDFCHELSFFNRFTQTSHPLNR